MKAKFFKKAVSVVLAAVMLTVLCVPGAFAATADDTAEYAPGEVLVSTNFRSESFVRQLLNDFELESIRLIMATDEGLCYHVIFTEKTTEIVWKAIEVLKSGSDIRYAEPNYYGQYLPIDEPATDSPTEPATTPDEPVTEPPVEETTEPEFAPGEVLVSTNFRSESYVRELLNGFELESVRLIMATDEGLCYHVIFTEKTTEIVWKAIEVLKADSDIRYAEPNYYGQYLPIDEPATDSPTEPATTPDDSVTEPPVEETTEPEFAPGEVLVSTNFRSESYVRELLNGFELESVRLIMATDEGLCYHVIFTEKTTEIVWKAIEVLKSGSDIRYAEPNYYGQYLPIDEPATDSPTEPATTPDESVTEPPVEETTEPEFAPGEVLVSTNFRSESFVRELLNGFELESVRLIMATDEGLCYHVIFTEKTTEIVWKAIEVLKADSDIRYAEPNYYMSLAVDPEQPTTSEDNSPVIGDADGDGELTIKDASCIQLYLADLMTLDEEQVAAADADGDGKLTIKDAAYIQLSLAGLL